ncbi:hypothetical protein NERG_01985 [Nematocida ausubeli]|uniref:Uncharacterized protein n=1 Tax=Nematocida ausubeli (strain ATCC PRA-371 / ERTm2) TaxID=1913371 RepID=H8ZEG4_NEMA1|nr:hypothetical protein NERG_01985 [Nematocida ausubeli]
MTYYTKTNDRIKAHTIVVLCIVGIWMIFGTCVASNECNDSNTAKIKESLKNSNKSDLASAMSDESRNRMPEPLNLSLASKNTAPNSKNHESGTHHPIAPEQKSIIVTTFYIDDFGKLFYMKYKSHRIYMYSTKIQVHKDHVLYNVYNDKSGNQILIDSSIRPYSFGTKDISSRAHSSQEESILNLVKVTTPKRLRDSTSTSSNDNLSSKKRKSEKSRENTDYIHRTKIPIKLMPYQTAYKNLKTYKSQAQSDTIRDKPHDFSYLFTKGGMDNGNTKCECSIEENYENHHDLWHFLTSSRHKSLAEKIECINNLANEIETEKNNRKRSNYRHFLLKDLKKYIETHIDIAHISATYDYTDRNKNNICSMSKTEPETLEEIYEETQTDLKWWANSMSIISAKTEEMKKECSIDDAELKEKLHFILKLPEVLRDLVLITPEIFLKTKEEVENHSNLEASKFFCIIEYLYYLVNDDADKMNIAYNEVKALSVNEESIYTCITMEVYRAVYDVFCLFYQCAPFTCVADVKSEEGKAEKKEARIKSIFQSHCPYIPQNGVFRLRGKRAIVLPTLGKYNLYETTNSTSNDFNSMVINQQNPLFLNVAYQCSKEHYHVQLVDNIRHTVKLVPIPYPPYCENYISRDGSMQRKTHSIRYIVEYIKSVLKSTYPEKNSEFNVYPFKYKKNSGIWTLIDENFILYDDRELDLALSAVNSYNHDVVFYYFENSLTQNNFRCMDFQISADSNSETPRIPLFLTNFMLTSAIISPYMFFDKENIQTEKIENYATEEKKIRPTKMIIDTAATSQNSSSASPSNNESQPKRSYVNYYYSDFLIQNIHEKEFCTAECFSAGISLKLSEKTGLLSTVWYTQIKKSVREYASYSFHISAAQKLLRESLLRNKKEVAPTLLDILQRENLSGDKVTYGLCIYTSLSGKEVAVPIMCEKMRKLLGANIDDDLKSKHANWESDILPPCIDIKDIKEDTTVFITVKTFNYTQANLGIHYDMLAALFHNNDNSALAP